MGNVPLSIPAHEWRRQGQRINRIMRGNPLWAARRYDVTAVATAAVRESRTDRAFPAPPESGPKAALRPTHTSWAIRTGCRPERVPDSESPCPSSAGEAPCLCPRSPTQRRPRRGSLRKNGTDERRKQHSCQSHRAQDERSGGSEDTCSPGASGKRARVLALSTEPEGRETSSGRDSEGGLAATDLDDLLSERGCSQSGTKRATARKSPPTAVKMEHIQKNKINNFFFKGWAGVGTQCLYVG